MGRKNVVTTKYVLETNRPNLKLFQVDLDPQTKALLDAREDGTVMEHPLAKGFVIKGVAYHAAECLDWNKDRETRSIWKTADEYGRIFCDTPEEALQVMNQLKNDTSPAIKLSDLSPEIPEEMRKDLDPNVLKMID